MPIQLGGVGGPQQKNNIIFYMSNIPAKPSAFDKKKFLNYCSLDNT
jgi:hypothetical protein